MKKILFVIIILSLFLISADGDDEIYLPLIANAEIPDGLRISSADCNYIIIDWKNPPLVPDISQDAGLAFISPNDGLMKWETIHYWYHVPETLTWRYWVYYPFTPGVFYWLDAYIYGGSGGLFWVENGDQLWLPCPPH